MSKIVKKIDELMKPIEDELLSQGEIKTTMGAVNLAMLVGILQGTHLAYEEYNKHLSIPMMDQKAAKRDRERALRDMMNSIKTDNITKVDEDGNR